MGTDGLPNDLLSNLDPLALIIFIPIFDIIVRRFVAGLLLFFFLLTRTHRYTLSLGTLA